MNPFHLRKHSTGLHRRQSTPAPSQAARSSPLTLLDVPPGYRAKIAHLNSQAWDTPPGDPAASPPGLEQLQAYGLANGYWVRVLQRTPVIILQIDHLELAMEKSLAARVIVDEISSSPNDLKLADKY